MTYNGTKCITSAAPRIYEVNVLVRLSQIGNPLNIQENRYDRYNEALWSG